MTDGLDPSEANGKAAAAASSMPPSPGAEEQTVRPSPGPSGALLGRRIGPYLLVQRLGGGAMATVYRALRQAPNPEARQPAGQAVALKVLLPDADAVMRERFRREAETHSNLDHANIVRILEVGQTAGDGSGHPGDGSLTYIAMELVEGPNLSEVMEEKGRLSAVDAARLLEPVARALDYANRQGIVHRDVKPSNVLLRMVDDDTPGAVRIDGFEKPLVPLLSDFGIARALDAPELTSVGRTIGTPTYMSPEQCADSHEIDGRSDLYSLGAVFYRCIVGRPPYSGSTTQILHAHVYDPLTIPDDVLATLPSTAVTILRRTLAKDPVQRYADNGELADDLHHLITADARPNGEDGADSTATMPVLPALPLGHAGTGYSILVPGVGHETTATTAASVAVPMAAVGATTGAPQVFIPVDATLPREAPREHAERRIRRRWIGAVIGGALAALVLIFGGGLALNLLPEELVGVRPAASPAPTGDITKPLIAAATATARAASLAITGTNGTTAVVSGGAVAMNATPGTTAATAAPSTPGTTPPVGGAAATPSPGPQAAIPTAAIPTPSGDIKAYWADAAAAYADADWERAFEFITLSRRIDPRYEGSTGDQMLFDSLLGLAAQDITGQRPDKALERLDAALALRPDEEAVTKIRRALEALNAPGTLNISMARWTLATTLAAYAQDLLDKELPCSAAEQLKAAVSLAPRESSGQLVAETQASCDKARRTADVKQQLQSLAGRLLYSTQEGDQYRIYGAAAKVDGDTALVVQDGAQPAHQQRGTLMAFRSTNPAQPGIDTLDLAGGQGSSARTTRLTYGASDAHDAPPSWSMNDRLLAFGSSSYGDRRPRVYKLDASGGNPSDLGIGRDPAWHPSQDRIVYNGVDDHGGQPGLWVMNGNGDNRTRLTDDGNDIRPAWTPDGTSIVFMSRRDGNWEVYRLSFQDNKLTRLTNDPAQDGLPTVSPDGKWVAFASDRGGFWRIWVVSIDGGEALPLLTVKGVLTNWLEHSIQWIP